ncbi:MAG: helix-turn-helix transcriptional regulator [Opitutales bacterium]|nr:helix-turn-helix transcriptional regulator [Opitutales bacterium]
MTDTEEDILARKLWALGDSVRLRIISRLPRSADCKNRNNVSELAEDLGIPQPTLSHHLRILRQAGLVSNKRMCRDVYYWLDEAAAHEVAKQLCDYVRDKVRDGGEKSVEPCSE